MANTPRPLASLIERIARTQEEADGLIRPDGTADIRAVRAVRSGLREALLLAVERDLMLQYGMAAIRNGPGSERVQKLAVRYEAEFGGRRAKAS